MGTLTLAACRETPSPRRGVTSVRASATATPTTSSSRGLPANSVVELGFRYERDPHGGTFHAVVEAQRWSCPLLEYEPGERCGIATYHQNEEVLEVVCGLRPERRATFRFLWVGGVNSIRSPLGPCSLPVATAHTELKLRRTATHAPDLEPCPRAGPTVPREIRVERRRTPTGDDLGLTVSDLG